MNYNNQRYARSKRQWTHAMMSACNSHNELIDSVLATLGSSMQQSIPSYALRPHIKRGNASNSVTFNSNRLCLRSSTFSFHSSNTTVPRELVRCRPQTMILNSDDDAAALTRHSTAECRRHCLCCLLLESRVSSHEPLEMSSNT
jgi:hypothetical protein